MIPCIHPGSALVYRGLTARGHEFRCNARIGRHRTCNAILVGRTPTGTLHEVGYDSGNVDHGATIPPSDNEPRAESGTISAPFGEATE